MVLVLTLWVVLTTVVINGITMAPLMRMLRYTRVPNALGKNHSAAADGHTIDAVING